MVNKVILVGNVGRDPEVRFLPDGSKVVNFSLATSEYWTDKSNGERKSVTEWHRIVIFNQNLAGIAEKHIKKGSKVFVEGQIKTRKWRDAAGQDKQATEVVLNQYRGELNIVDRQERDDSHGSSQQNTQNDDFLANNLSDDITF